MKENKRKHSRVPIKLETEITFPDESTFHGITKNLSFSGIFIHCDELANTDRRGNCVLKIGLATEKESEAIEISARLIRSSKNGAGFQLSSISMDDYEHFERLILFNSSDQDTLIDELETNPGINKV